MAIINENGVIGSIIDAFINNIAGSETTAVMAIVIFLIALTLMWRLPVELQLVILFPIIIVSAFYYTALLPVFTVATLYMAFILARKVFNF